MKTSDPFNLLKSALNDNPGCRLGIMARKRMAFAEKGVNSYKQDRELLALIAPGWWYGYIRRTDPRHLKSTGQGEWIAILVQSAAHVDGRTPTEVFRCLHRNWEEYLLYHPYYVQEPEDGMALCASFDEAVKALCHIVERFDICKRESCEIGSDGLPVPPENGKLDMRCMDLFGLCGLTNEEKFEKYEWPRIEAARRKAGLPPFSEYPQP